ncbi:MAG: hypothetical protein NC235_07630 [Clostridiales bacterium]|nr:hypothetical protein [Clostridiales bacterium]MCM1576973.1 hypothetical protein [Bacteroides sp.]
MMKTDSDIKNDVYQMLLQSPIVDAVTGTLRKIERIPDSTDEDIIISILANDNPREIQEAYVNVNIYVRDLQEKYSLEIHYVEDTLRIEMLSRIIADMFDEAFIGDSYRITLASQRVLEVAATKEHCINTRLLYQQINEKQEEV